MENNKVEECIKDIIDGRPIIVVDDFDREFEGDLVMSAENASKKSIEFSLLHARGLMCVPCTGERLDRLKIPLMVENTTDPLETPFTVSVDGYNTTTGMSIDDRIRTINILVDNKSVANNLKRPGHIFPLRARDGLLMDRRGHTESSIEMMRLCKLEEISIIIEIMNNRCHMMKGKELEEYSKKHNIKLISVDEISKFVYGN